MSIFVSSKSFLNLLKEMNLIIRFLSYSSEESNILFARNNKRHAL